MVSYAESGYFKSIADKIMHDFKGSVFMEKKNQQYWNPVLSCRNKYKNGNKEEGPKFFGSTTFLVWTTDAWHRYDMLYMTAQQLPFCVIAVHALVVRFSANGWWYLLVLPLLGLVKLVAGVPFEHYYKKWTEKK
jgi:hypothetical protein